MINGAYTGPPFPELEVHNIKGLRFYETPTGEKYPSITTVLGKQPGKQKGLQEWRERVGVAQAQIISGKAARRGSVFHNIVENYLQDEDISDFKQQNFMAWCMFGGMKSHLDEKINQVVLQEQTMFSSKFKVAGRCDLIGVYKDKLSVVDFKTTTTTKKEEWIGDYFIQCAAYASMYEEHTGESVEDIVIMMVAEDGEVQLFEKKTADYLPLLEVLMDDFYETVVSDLQAA
jgi:genome maintenance exonuclease 1